MPAPDPQKMKCEVCGVMSWRQGATCIRCLRLKERIQGRATGVVSAAVQRGDIPAARTLKCVDCGKRAREYDHRHYARPLDIEPVCRSCNFWRGGAKDLYRLIRKELRLAGIILLSACASTPAVYVGRDCAGSEITVHYTQYESPWPLLDCARLASACGASDGDVLLLTLQLPSACAYRGPRCSFIVLPPAAPEWVRAHELDHLRGAKHGAAPWTTECRHED